MARSAQREWMGEGEGVPLLIGILLASSISLGMWMMVSYVSWLLLR